MQQATSNKVSEGDGRLSPVLPLLPGACCLLLSPSEAFTVSEVRLADASLTLRDRDVAATGLKALLLS
jgi:hypothetical protein